MGNLIYWQNNTDEDVIATAYHNAVKIRFYGIKCPAHGNATPYLPKYQSYEYTIRFYDKNDKVKLAEYQYICIEKESFIAMLGKDENGQYKITVYPTSASPGNPRPVYVVAHRCNNPGNIKHAIKKGANGVECDVRCNSKGDKWVVNHDSYTPLTSMQLSDWLAEAKAEDKLCLIYFDIKDGEYADKLHDYVQSNLVQTSNKKIATIYGISSIKNAGKFKNFASKLKEWEGMIIDYDDDPSAVQRFFKEDVKTSNFWYADGINAGCLDSDTLRNALRKAGELRDTTNDGIKKTLIWTIEKKETTAEYIYNEKVDGIMTNAGGGDFPRDKIANIMEIINCSATVRLATRDDNPFKVFRK